MSHTRLVAMLLQSSMHVMPRAVELAERYEFPQVEIQLSRHASQLLKKGDCLQAVEVYRMAGKATDAALLLAKLAEDAGKDQTTGIRTRCRAFAQGVELFAQGVEYHRLRRRWFLTNRIVLTVKYKLTKRNPFHCPSMKKYGKNRRFFRSSIVKQNAINVSFA